MRPAALTSGLAALLVCLCLPGAVLTQQASGPSDDQAAPVLPHAPVVTLDRDRLYAESDLGKAAEARFEQESAALVAENRRLEAALEQEERSLTERRATLPADEFRKLATEFDTRVEDLRKAQDAKSRALTKRREEGRQAFFEAAVPVLGRLMVDLNAVAIIERSAIILTFDQFDITNLAIERLNAETTPESLPDLPPVEGATPDSQPTEDVPPPTPDGQDTKPAAP